MAAQLLIYEHAVPVSSVRHAKHSVDLHAGYAFSRHLNVVPLTAIEFAAASSEYTIVFAGEGDMILPAAILGVRSNENLYLDDEGAWQARYVPAFIRRYPFVFARSDDGQTLTLCIDESYAGFNDEGRGQRLFDDDNKPTTYVDNILKFVRQYQAHFHRTQLFCQRLRTLDLLAPVQAQVAMRSGGRMSVTGFLAVDRKKLKALPAETLAELVKSDEIELIYAHLHSMRNFTQVRDRLAAGHHGTATPTPVDADPALSGMAGGGNGASSPSIQ